MDDELTANDFRNTCNMCKDCAFQNRSHYFKGKCKIYIHSKPESVRLNGNCEFYVQKGARNE